MILPTKEHRQNAHRLPPVVDIEPEDGASDVEMPQSGKEIVMTLVAMGGGKEAFRSRANLL